MGRWHGARRVPCTLQAVLLLASVLLVTCQSNGNKPGANRARIPQRPIAYQGSAFLMGYYAGVTQSLLEQRVLVPGVTPTSGISGGALTVTAAQLGLNGTQILGFWKKVLGDSLNRFKQGGGLVGQLAVMTAYELAKVMPPEPQIKVNGVLRIAVSQLNSSKQTLNDSASWVVDSWDNKEDLISNLVATSYLSCYSGPTTHTLFRNQPVMDGGYGNGFKEICPPGDTSKCLKVASFYVGNKADKSCDKRCGQASMKAGCRTEERRTTITKRYENTGYIDRWPLTEVQLRCPSTTWADLPPYPGPVFVPQGAVRPDIHPGRYNPLPLWPPNSTTRLSACQWQNFALSPPLDRMGEFLDVTYKLGYEDANAWAAQQQTLLQSSSG